MRRAFCVLAVLMNQQSYKVGNNMKMIKNFKEWKFKNVPSYAELPIDDNPEYNVPKAVINAVFSKVNFRDICMLFCFVFDSIYTL